MTKLKSNHTFVLLETNQWPYIYENSTPKCPKAIDTQTTDHRLPLHSIALREHRLLYQSGIVFIWHALFLLGCQSSNWLKDRLFEKTCKVCQIFALVLHCNSSKPPCWSQENVPSEKEAIWITKNRKQTYSLFMIPTRLVSCVLPKKKKTLTTLKMQASVLLL